MAKTIKTVTKPFLAIALCALITVSLGGCARSQDPNMAYKSEINDPIEPVNRAIFGFNNALDIVIIEPLAKGYDFILPTMVKDSIRNFMRNLRSPLIVGNNLLQGDLGDAGIATARFVINSTVGIGGLLDVAASQGFVYEEEDFGQTLAVWGLGNGFYLVLPILGPSSLRDGVGRVADAVADPVRLIAHNTDNDWIYYTRNAVEGLDNRARLLSAIRDLRRNSLDYYAAMRSAYVQKRHSLIRDVNPETSPSIPDYDEEY